ncbi:MAG: hypothetical protein R2911_09880 [Caldilineaceae bacterium]
MAPNANSPQQIEHIYRSQQLDERTVLAIDEWIVPTGIAFSCAASRQRQERRS